jgi:hypothetical protein
MSQATDDPPDFNTRTTRLKRVVALVLNHQHSIARQPDRSIIASYSSEAMLAGFRVSALRIFPPLLSRSNAHQVLGGPGIYQARRPDRTGRRGTRRGEPCRRCAGQGRLLDHRRRGSIQSLPADRRGCVAVSALQTALRGGPAGQRATFCSIICWGGGVLVRPASSRGGWMIVASER